ncbi:hypothetical protein [Vibrio fluminensis]|uniref:hypothetical protein n=1 Tax=Vibrio fluminensis TaxID=2783614 RepID=UPI001886BD37|nr:hypothetical protein [Vibrio fluminensis]
MRAFFEVHLRLVITVWVILVSVLGLLYLMNYMKFDSLMSGVVSSKLDVISSSLDTSIQRVERLGIPYHSAENLKEQFIQARQREENVSSITLIDAKGNALLQVSKNEQQLLAIPEDVIRRALSSNEPRWLYSDDNQLFSGLQTFGDYGRISGSLIIQYDKTALYGVYATVRLHLLEATVVIFLLTALIVFLVVRIGFSDVANVMTLIQRYSSGDKHLDSRVAVGSMSQSFAEQIRQSEEMKAQVNEELERLQALSRQMDRSDDIAKQDNKTEVMK